MSMENIMPIIKARVKQHGFFDRNSISPLALEVSGSCKPKICSRWAPYNVKTEEKWQKIRSRSISLLNNLNLDLPKPSERILRVESILGHLGTAIDPLCLPFMEIDDDFYRDFVSHTMYYICIHPSCIDSHRREKVLKLFVKLDAFNCFDQVHMQPVVLMHLVDLMHAEFEDTDFVEKCFKKFRFDDMLQVNVEPEKVEKLLYLVHRQGAKLDREIWGCEFSNRCFLHASFEYVDYVLKFAYAPHLSTSFFKLLSKDLKKIMPRHPAGYMPTSMQVESNRRGALLLHLYWTYFYKFVNPSAAAKSLLLVWNAVPDSFISFKELDSLFVRAVFKDSDDIYSFYTKAVGEYHEDFNPRSLQHFCRYTIRKRLWKSNQWIPEGIEQLHLPPAIKSYLKLEM